MNIALISGSPKKTGSTSKTLLNDLKGLLLDEQLDEENIKEFDLHTSNITEEEIESLCKYSVWVFAFPLYVDGIPSHLLSCLYKMEQLSIEGKNIRVYAVVNCGFYEGEQACNALDILKNWCHKADLTWGAGIGYGGGGALSSMEEIPVGSGPKATLGKAYKELISAILSQSSIENIYTSIGFPRFLYKSGGHRGWRKMIKANGGKRKDLKRRL